MLSFQSRAEVPPQDPPAIVNGSGRLLAPSCCRDVISAFLTWPKRPLSSAEKDVEMEDAPERAKAKNESTLTQKTRAHVKLSAEEDRARRLRK